MPLTQRERRIIDKYAQKIDDGPNSLYKALHYVGDDPVKAEIEDVLQRLLPEQTYREVVAVFLAATDDDCTDDEDEETK